MPPATGDPTMDRDRSMLGVSKHLREEPSMCRTLIALAALTWALSLKLAAGCELLDAAAESPLQTRKPVLGAEVFLASGFGVNYHPILAMQRMHQGVDWRAPLGTPVIAAGSGRVMSAGNSEREYGNWVVIDHGGSWQTVYAHLTRFAVKAGDCVVGGTVIGTVGVTGLSAGPHLHFEVRRDGTAVDPMMLRLQPQAKDGRDKR